VSTVPYNTVPCATVSIQLPLEVATRTRLLLQSNNITVACTDIELLGQLLQFYLDPDQVGPSAVIEKLCAWDVLHHIEDFGSQLLLQ